MDGEATVQSIQKEGVTVSSSPLLQSDVVKKNAASLETRRVKESIN